MTFKYKWPSRYEVIVPPFRSFSHFPNFKFLCSASSHNINSRGLLGINHIIMFVCYLIVEDLERNNGHDKPYFMSKQLMKLLDAKNFREGTDGEDGEEIQMESVETNKS